MDEGALILTILILQIVGVAGAKVFARLSDRVGNVRALITALIVWLGICLAGYFVQRGWSFYVLASTIGFGMAGVQSLARSTYAKLIPENTPDSASWYSFFDVTEKIAVVIGTATFSSISLVSGTMRNSLLALAVFFALGLGLLLTLRGRALRLHSPGPAIPPVASGGP
jgi:UMF1 family MFS transporter